ncbi:MAG: hypothetical protein FJ267_05595, partial [Planctomycetes bacterium]|nr:hypothetical protein [Planctomycetota bacterium]
MRRVTWLLAVSVMMALVNGSTWAADPGREGTGRASIDGTASEGSIVPSSNPNANKAGRVALRPQSSDAASIRYSRRPSSAPSVATAPDEQAGSTSLNNTSSSVKNSKNYYKDLFADETDVAEGTPQSPAQAASAPPSQEDWADDIDALTSPKSKSVNRKAETDSAEEQHPIADATPAAGKIRLNAKPQSPTATPKEDSADSTSSAARPKFAKESDTATKPVVAKPVSAKPDRVTPATYDKKPSVSDKKSIQQVVRTEGKGVRNLAPALSEQDDVANLPVPDFARDEAPPAPSTSTAGT